MTFSLPWTFAVSPSTKTYEDALIRRKTVYRLHRPLMALFEEHAYTGIPDLDFFLVGLMFANTFLPNLVVDLQNCVNISAPHLNLFYVYSLWTGYQRSFAGP